MLSLDPSGSHIDGVGINDLADRFGTPLYVYSAGHMRSQYARLSAGLAPVSAGVRYAVKANSNLAVLRLFAELGSGFDVVSGGELERVRRAGGDLGRTVFSGVGKRVDEIDFALKLGIECINVESASELRRVGQRAELAHTIAPVSLRVNPNVDAATHPYISTGLRENKFGVPIDQALPLYLEASAHPNLNVTGIDCHIGSQIAETAPLLEAAGHVLGLADELAARGIEISHLDLGGGFGVSYGNEAEFDVAAYGQALAGLLDGRALRILVEPGRFLVAGAGALLTRVEYLKPSDRDGPSFAVVDAAMNDLIRPALYQAEHAVQAIPDGFSSDAASDDNRTTIDAVWDIVGPVCESGDFLARGRRLSLAEGQLVGIAQAGAYGIGLASNYNTRLRPAEVLIDNAEPQLIRRRESLAELLQGELID